MTIARGYRVRVPRPWHIALAVFAVAALTAGCGTDHTPTGTDELHPDTLYLSEDSLTLPRGTRGSLVVTVPHDSGFTGVIELSVDGAGAGVTWTFSPPTLSNGATFTTLTVSTTSTTPIARTVLTVRAKGQHTVDQTIEMPLNVIPTEAAGISLAINPGIVSIPRGGSRAIAVTLTRFGSATGSVNLSLSGGPAGVTYTFQPATLSDAIDVSTLTLFVALTTVPGTYTVVVRADASGISDVTETFTLTVSPNG